ncbi:hypothetical protein SAMN05892877_1704 [Rhizobium subbaraonis]|uniref:GT-D fold-like domain-containing protein n=1 Tax=Rhizobium subbaraonis TaxID=908946 RepID=A0A285V354_9HYPH|nr:hypothetical protein [Rhizobium subbaraonis]SOC48453.1 hypothetical protein SAMN05892877_1704 [Rhizobium subbaraonis]
MHTMPDSMYVDGITNELSDIEIQGRITTAALNAPAGLVVQTLGLKRIVDLAVQTFEALGVHHHVSDDGCRISAAPVRQNPEQMLRHRIGDGARILTSEGKLLDGVGAAIADEIGYSMIRLNHCEPKVMGFGKFFTKEAVMTSFRMQWGVKQLPREDIENVAAFMIEASRNADALGIPDRFSGSLPQLALLEHAAFTVGHHHEILTADKLYISIRSGVKLAVSERFFSLMRSARNVVVISGREVEGRLQAKLGAGVKLTSIGLEPEWRKSEKTSVGTQYPDAFKRIMRQMADRVGPGSLVLVGAGLLGKIFCGEAKRLGGVGIDLGSVIDAWCGLKTRGGGFPVGSELPPPGGS